jgi:hypothetical protein
MTTTISSSSFGSQRLSPRDLLQNSLTSQVASGKIDGADKDALSAALDTIDSAMRAERGSFSSARTAPPSPDQAKAKVDGLIDAQVESGSLTSEQADGLKQLFADTFANGPGGPGGPPPGPPPGGGEDGTTTSLTITSDDADVTRALQDFLKQLQEKLGSGYSASGQSSGSSGSSVLFDISA